MTLISVRWIQLAVLIPAVMPFTAIRSADNASLADKLIEASGVKGGLIVHVGCGDGKRAAAFRASGPFLVHGLDTDTQQVEKARTMLRTKNLCGPVSISSFDGKTLPFIENTVNLIVCEKRGALTSEELSRVLVPKGKALIKDGELLDAKSVSIAGEKWFVFQKPASAKTDDWTHFFYDAKANPVSKDSTVNILRRYQWIADPVWSRHHEHMASTSALVSAQGRLFYIVDDGPRYSPLLPPVWNLYARDAFNGTLLWKKPVSSWVTHVWPLKSGPAQVARRLVADDDMVFAIMGMGEKVSVFKGATGKLLHTCEGTTDATEIVYSKGTLFVTVEPAFRDLNKQDFKQSVGWNNKKQALTETPWRSETEQAVVAIDACTGSETWRHKGPVAPMTLLAGEKRVYFHDGAEIVALNRKTGAREWSVDSGFSPKAFYRNAGARLLLHDGILLFSVGKYAVRVKGPTPKRPRKGTKGAKAKPVKDHRILAAFDCNTGKQLWQAKPQNSGHESTEDLFVIAGSVWTSGFRDSATGLDPKSGKPIRTLKKDIKLFPFHQRCYPSKAVGRFVLSGNPGIEFVDLKTEKWTPHHWTRGGCIYGVMPANGLVYTPPHACACYLESKTFGLSAFAPQSPVSTRLKNISDEDRLEKGPAYAQIGNSKSAIANRDDWPTYRADGARSGLAKSKVAEKPSVAWQQGVGKSELTAPVAALGSVFVAEKDTHTLFALNAETGKVQWSFVAGGRIDSPPTIHNGVALFGCHDGWIYALRATDGALAWRYRAAPLDRRMMAFDQIESVWPVHGSVLVHDGVLYAIAGRSMFLDSGLRFLKLDPKTGRKLGETILDESNPKTKQDLQNDMTTLSMPVALPDILSTSGKKIDMAWMKNRFARQNVFDRELRLKEGQDKLTGTKYLWQKMDYPLMVRAMALAGKQLLIAGVPDTVDEEKLYATFHSKELQSQATDQVRAMRGGKGFAFRIVSAETGETVSELKCSSAPVWDGMAVAGGKVFIATLDGMIVCLSGKHK